MSIEYELVTVDAHTKVLVPKQKPQDPEKPEPAKEDKKRERQS